MLIVNVVEIVVLIATRCRNRRSGTVVGIGCRREVSRRSRHRDIVLRRTRIARLRSRFVAAREDRYTTLDRAIRRASIVGEVVQRTLFERSTCLPRLLRRETSLAPIVDVGSTRNIAPTALQNHSAIVGSILDRANNSQRTRTRNAREDLANHNLHTIAGATTARYRADTHTIIIDCRDHTRNVRAVTRVIDIVPRDDTRALHKVVTVAVALVAIRVVILARTPHLVLIDPDVSLQVGMFDKNTLVEHRNNHLLVARRAFPRTLALHIGITHRLDLVALAELIATIDEVPLSCQQRVVHRLNSCSRCALSRRQTLCTQRSSLAAIGTFDRAVEINRLYLAQRLQTLSHLLGRATRTKTDHIPLMQTLLAGALLGALVDREDTLQLIALDSLQHLVQSHRTATCRRTARSLNLRDHIGNLRSELHDHLTLNIGSRDLRLGGRGRRNLAFGTRRKRHCGRYHRQI